MSAEIDDAWVQLQADHMLVLAERDSLRAQLAAAQRVPEDAALDALVTRMRSDGYIHADKAIDAITALRRRVAELERAARAALPWVAIATAIGDNRHPKSVQNAITDLATLRAAIAKEPQDA